MACFCKDCNVEFHAFNYKMVMLHDSLWSKVCDHEEDIICDKCIEKRLHRKLTVKDLKYGEFGHLDKIPVNMWYAEKHKLKY